MYHEIMDQAEVISSLNNPEFYEDIEHFLRHGTVRIDSEWQHRQLKKLSKEYKLVEGALCHGLNDTKTVVIDLDEQQKLSMKYHKPTSSPFHFNTSETLKILQKLYFWEDMEVTVKNVLRNCQDCQDAKSWHWRRSFLTLSGPFETEDGQFKSVCLLSNLDTGWMLGTTMVANPNGQEDLNFFKAIAKFMFESMCQFGFFPCYVSLGEGFQYVLKSFAEQLSMLQLPDLQPESFLKNGSTFKYFKQGAEGKKVGDFVSKHGKKWENYFHAWLFHQRISENDAGKTAFSIVFNRDPILVQDDYPMDNTDNSVSAGRRPLRKSVHQCRHCGDTFTSTISFKIHQDKHLDSAFQKGMEECDEILGNQEDEIDDHSDVEEEEEDSKVRKMLRRKTKAKRKKRGMNPEERYEVIKKRLIEKDNNKDIHDESDQEIEPIKADTFHAIKALLNVTKNERTKRGKYVSYTPWMRDEIAKFALENGIQAASEHFTEQYGINVTQSSVRNFIKSYKRYPQELRVEIGRYAYQFGLSQALEKYHNEKVGNVGNLRLNKGNIKRFLEHFNKDHPYLPNEEEKIMMLEVKSRVKVPFPTELTEEIGKYAAHHGNFHAVSHFSTKLDFPIRAAIVNDFKKSWLKDNKIDDHEKETPVENLEQPNQIITVQMQSFDNPPITDNSVQQTTTVIFNQGTSTSDSSSSVVGNQSKIVVTQSPSLVQPLSLTINTGNPSSSMVRLVKPIKKESEVISPVTAHKEPNADDHLKQTEQDPALKKKKTSKRGKRKSYTKYTPELRAKIGRYAMNHSVPETIRHFMKHEDLEVPEATIRQFKDRYLLKSKQREDEEEEPEELEYGARGRRLMLGKFDSAVMNCIVDLVKSGEKLCSFLVIATAKRILLEKSPDMLIENGGSTNLTTSWAKSFCTRVKRSGLLRK